MTFVNAVFFLFCVILFVMVLPKRNMERFVSTRPVIDASGAKYKLVTKFPKTLLLEARKDLQGVPVDKNIWIDVVTKNVNSRVQGLYYVLDVAVEGNRDMIYLSEARMFTMKQVNASLNPKNNGIVIAHFHEWVKGDLIFFTDSQVYCKVEVVDYDGTTILRLMKGRDDMCLFDNECPFFGTNGLRGGCNSGYCELPDGVARTGYKTFSGVPTCADANDCEKPQFSNDVLEMRAFVQYDNVLDPPVPL